MPYFTDEHIHKFLFTFTIFILTWIKFNTRDQQIMPLNIGEFHENQNKEGCTSLTDVNKIMFTPVHDTL
jgi:hypothetical protein